jgi:hypothetical protein
MNLDVFGWIDDRGCGMTDVPTTFTALLERIDLPGMTPVLAALTGELAYQRATLLKPGRGSPESGALLAIARGDRTSAVAGGRGRQQLCVTRSKNQ